MKPLFWKLESVFPTYADLLTTLDTWFVGPGCDRLKARYKMAGRFHPGQLRRWRRRASAPWELKAVRRLFAVRAAVVETALALYRDSGQDTWLLLNCQPAGGHWKAEYTKGIEGRHCRSWLCPWCYLRRINQLRSVLLQPAGSVIEVRSGQHSAALGFAEPLNLLTITWMNSDLYHDKALFQEFRLKAEKVARLGLADDGSGFKPSGQAEYHTALRTLSPVFRDSGPAGMRIGFIYYGSAPAGDRFVTGLTSRQDAEILVERQRGLTAWEALRYAQPYPAKALITREERATAGMAQLLLSGMKGLSAYGMVRSRQALALKI